MSLVYLDPVGPWLIVVVWKCASPSCVAHALLWWFLSPTDPLYQELLWLKVARMSELVAPRKRKATPAAVLQARGTVLAKAKEKQDELNESSIQWVVGFLRKNPHMILPCQAYLEVGDFEDTGNTFAKGVRTDACHDDNYDVMWCSS